jgi:formylglycine-generating enzyme required for sulfatase activity
MAGLTRILALAAAVFGAGGILRGQDPGQKGFDTEVTCARCHVSSSLEWGISKHSLVTRGARLPNCVGCHGESRGHVADEQNSVKPERLPRGAAIAQLCLECHRSGCPETRARADCEECHHPHALVNPKFDPAAVEAHARELSAEQAAYASDLARGEALAARGRWEEAREAFAAALKENPGDAKAAAGVERCLRRLNPGIPGFRIVGDRFDPQTGWPEEIVLDRLGLDLVLVPAGSFDMGSERNPGSEPVHTVDVPAFYLSKVEVTQAQWKAVLGNNPSLHQGAAFPDADRLPVERVSWNDCRALLATINRQVPGGGFRLPTEAEWEYAARAGSASAPAPAEVLRQAWLEENSEPPNLPPPVRTGLYLIGAGVTSVPHPVGTREPNRWGLCDMLGDVSVWCSSLESPYPYRADDGRESVSDPGPRIIRGASFADFVENADPGLRHSGRPDLRLPWIGVRLAFVPPAFGVASGD